MPASLAQLDAPSDWRPGGRGFNPLRGRQHSFVEIDHEIFSCHSLPFADSRRAVVSFWRKNVHNLGITAFKFVILGGKSAVLRSEISFHGDASAEP